LIARPEPSDGRTFSDVRVVVFDLGGVLLRLRDPLTNFDLELDEAEFQERWLRSPAVREFERGACDAETFGRTIVREFGLSMSWRSFLERFDAWPEQIYPETTLLLDAVPAGVGRVLLSNTNAAHWNRRDIALALTGRVDKTFLSFRTGLLKPDREAFMQVVRAYGMLPEAFLFFDDNPLNVSAARATGMRAVLCEGPNEALRVVQRMQTKDTGTNV
jgi:putative hydrolase of the HAD superfamily